MNIKRNQTVKYESLGTPGRTFNGQVAAVYGDRAIVRHKGEPRYTTVPCHRLVIVHTQNPLFAGKA